ncbi:hypothetical protein OIO90_003296 [Microbotryomycetes sp. JL221]|nr:hypothetical protein OIO90_003296 [Microbotryomycetes sp. JL221]
MVSTVLRRAWRAYSVASKGRKHKQVKPNDFITTNSANATTAWDRLRQAQEQASKPTAKQEYDLSQSTSWADPPLVSAARKKKTSQRSIWESYLVMPAETRLKLSLALFAFGLIGLYGGDYLVPPTETEKQVRQGLHVDVPPVTSSRNV